MTCSNMIERQSIKTAYSFKRGDTVRTDGTEHIVDGHKGLLLMTHKFSLWSAKNGKSYVAITSNELTHKKPVTIASINEQLRHVLDKGHMSSWSMAAF